MAWELRWGITGNGKEQWEIEGRFRRASTAQKQTGPSILRVCPAESWILGEPSQVAPARCAWVAHWESRHVPPSGGISYRGSAWVSQARDPALHGCARKDGPLYSALPSPLERIVGIAESNRNRLVHRKSPPPRRNTRIVPGAEFHCGRHCNRLCRRSKAAHRHVAAGPGAPQRGVRANNP